MVYALIVLIGCACSSAARAAGDRIDSIVKRDFLRCGVHTGVPGLAVRDSAGRYRGLEIDFCTAVAVAILGPPGRVRFSEVPTLNDFLRTQDVDVAVRGLTESLARAARNSIEFGPVYFFDGQAFLVDTRSTVLHASDLRDRRVCTFGALEHALTLKRYFKEHKLNASVVALASSQEADEALTDGECTALSQDLTELLSLTGDDARSAGRRRRLLPERASVEPLAPVVRREDARLLRILKWTLAVLVRSEERAIDSSDISASGGSCRLFYARLGVASESGRYLGLRPEWACDVIRTGGNYGEIFARHFGPSSDMPLDRGWNRLWSEGGMIYSPMLQ